MPGTPFDLADDAKATPAKLHAVTQRKLLGTINEADEPNQLSLLTTDRLQRDSFMSIDLTDFEELKDCDGRQNVARAFQASGISE